MYLDKKHLLLVDGMALLFRAFFATAVRKNYMYNSAGSPTNGVQGYLKHLLTAEREIKPTHIAVCWDMGSKTFRNDIFENYKSNREAPPVEMHPQFDHAKQVTEHLGIPNIGIVGYEADDCIGTICKLLKRNPNMQLSVLTGDRDLLQIVDDHVTVYIMQKGFGNYQTYTPETFQNEYDITPIQFIDVKALMGDSSDGYPGVKGIGEKTAFKLIREFQSIEGILENIQKLTPSVQKKLQSDIEMLHLSRKLAEIHRDVPLEFNLQQANWTFDIDDLIDKVEQHELKSVRNMLLQLKQAEHSVLNHA